MASAGPTGVISPTTAVDADRFVAFTFASANLVVECDPDGVILYAAGAFRTELGQPAEAFLGRHVKTLTVMADHEALDDGLWSLKERGRLLPMTVRMASQRHHRPGSCFPTPVDRSASA
jgi:PAS domain-containing protein